MVDLARHYDDGRRKAREIAAAMDIPARYVTQILANLVRQDLLVAVAGPNGGYALARPPAAISLLEVVEAAEGPIRLDECVLRGGPCDWERSCPIHDSWTRAQAALARQLDGTTFAQLAQADAALHAGTPDAPSVHHTTRPERRGRR